MTQLDGELRALAVTGLQQQQAAGELTSADVRATARELGVGERTVWRWPAATEPPPPRLR